jgi:hypothetical protein
MLLTEATESYEASNHEHRVEVELVLWIFSPCESSTVIQHPEQCDGQRTQEKDTSQYHNQHVLKPVGTCPFIVVFIVAVSETRQKGLL